MEIMYTNKSSELIKKNTITGIYGDKCPECNGNKRVNKTKTITVNIPKGIDNGQTIRIINGGECGLFGGTNGNLLINISITNDELFKRNKVDNI